MISYTVGGVLVRLAWQHAGSKNERGPQKKYMLAAEI